MRLKKATNLGRFIFAFFSHTQIMSLEEIDFEMVSSGHMDTEKPASLSTDYVVLIYTHLHNIRSVVINLG